MDAMCIQATIMIMLCCSNAAVMQTVLRSTSYPDDAQALLLRMVAPWDQNMQKPRDTCRHTCGGRACCARW